MIKNFGSSFRNKPAAPDTAWVPSAFLFLSQWYFMGKHTQSSSRLVMTFAISLLRLEAEMVPSGFYSSSPVRRPSFNTSRAYLAVLDSSCTLFSSCSSSAILWAC